MQTIVCCNVLDLQNVKQRVTIVTIHLTKHVHEGLGGNNILNCYSIVLTIDRTSPFNMFKLLIPVTL